MRSDPEAFDELLAEIDPADLPPGLDAQRPSGNFEYEKAEAKFDPAKLEGVSKVTFDALVKAGAMAFRVRYDGGYDEGFARSVELQFADGARSPDEVAMKLESAEFTTLVTAAAPTPKWFSKMDDLKVARSAIDWLAHDLASELLGDGYGTGEYELYGALTADLQTGKLTDDPAANKPDELE